MNKTLKTPINPVRNQRFLNGANGVKILILLITVFGAGLLFVLPANAQVDDLVVEFEKTPLFDEANFLPGQSITRWVKVTNNSGQPQRIAAESINYPGFVSGSPRPHLIPDNDLSRALLIVIREKGGSDLYGGSTGQKSLYEFYQNGETYLSDITTGEFKEYEFEVSFPTEKGDEWQEKTTNFDILIGFQGVAGGVPPGGGGGGSGLPPGLIIKDEGAVYVGTVTAKITWLTSYESTSRVIYDTKAGIFDLNNLPDYGYAFSSPEIDTPANLLGVTYHEVWITGLVPNTTYYYRCVSHASPPTISLEHSFTTLAALTEVEEGKIGEEFNNGIEQGREEGSEIVGREEISGGEGIILSGGQIVGGESAGQGGEEQKEKSVPEGELAQKAFFPNLLAGLGLFIEGISWVQWLIIILCLVILLFVFKKKKKEEKQTKPIK